MSAEHEYLNITERRRITHKRMLGALDKSGFSTGTNEVIAGAITNAWLTDTKAGLRHVIKSAETTHRQHTDGTQISDRLKEDLPGLFTDDIPTQEDFFHMRVGVVTAVLNRSLEKDPKREAAIKRTKELIHTYFPVDVQMDLKSEYL